MFAYISCLLGFAIIFAYCIVITIRNKEIPNSISQIVYSLSNRWKWTFSFIMFIVAFMIAPQMMIIAPANYKFLSFLMIVGILGVGADPLDKNKKNIVHYISAVISGVSPQILVYMIEPMLMLAWIPYILYTLYMEDGRKNMFIGEMVILVTGALICLL